MAGSGATGSGHRVVVVDDDDDLRDLLVRVLAGAGHDVSWAATGHDALALIREIEPDLITLDLSLPDMDGTEVCRQLRRSSDAYVVMITGRDAEVDRLVGLELGADDYLAKPFSPREVSARVGALLRRPRLGARAEHAAPPASAEVAVEDHEVLDVGGGLVLDRGAQVVTLAGQGLPLTPAELQLLQTLATHPGRVWQREQLVREVWGGEFVESDFLVDIHIGNLRRKLRRAGSAHAWVRAVEGAAYVFEPPDPTTPAAV